MKERIIQDLVKIGVIKTGEFTLKSGLQSDVYIDLRLIISYPEIMVNICFEMSKIAKNLNYDRIVGIPYSGIPLSTLISSFLETPMLLIRNERKSHGTKKLIEGVFKDQDKVLVIDDIITDGSSKIEIIQKLELHGLKVEDIIVLIDREFTGKKNLENYGCKVHSLLTLEEIRCQQKK